MPDYTLYLDLAHDCIMVYDRDSSTAEFSALECAATIDGEEN